MKIKIPYLKKTFPLEFPDENLLALAEPNEFKSSGAPEQILENALKAPYGPDSFTKSGPNPGGQKGQGLEDFIRGGKRVLVIINDATRPTPTEAILRGLLPVFEKAGLKAENLTLLVATGAHRGPTDGEYRQILGAFHDQLRSRCFHHDSRKDEDMVDLGSTRNGTPILLNKRLFEADRIIATGSVEPHYFAGFTGGRKAFLPGIAAYKTIQANHKQALSDAACSLALEGNPVHEDMMDALPLIKAPIFSFMTVLDKEQQVAAATTGDLMASFYAAVEIARKIFCVVVPAKADIVVSVAKFPMDIDLYQSQKAIDNGAAALKDGGTLILVSSCRDGIGDEAYANLLASASNPADALEKIRAGYKLGYHKAAKMAAVSARATVKAVTELPPERLKSMFIESAPSPQAALDEALAKARAGGVKSPKILVLPDGCVTVPDPGLL
ncbi:general glycosylation pathway protein [Treponema primitia ZAS-2]|uniref:General glycosylation pathway protein n=1 Tax=Treponema primitia (strain ATCC BAA-887 / DSM 12427 / ZAS-2) TaxID=545694 RepID=F5YMB1_TREPZ|nr:nickel-dependent lactate racemase [Treponema primitia]AEF85301.1 general glycosylation pathway protein [Treponema primitia ZAS-2]